MGAGRGERDLIEAVLEDRVDVAIGAGGDAARAGARGFQPGRAVALGQAQDAEARAIALLGMRAVGEDRLDEGRGLRADRLGPADDARGRPLQMALMGLGHVGGVGGVAAADVAAGDGRRRAGRGGRSRRCSRWRARRRPRARARRGRSSSGRAARRGSRC